MMRKKSRKQHKRCNIRPSILCFHPSLLCYCHQKGKDLTRRRTRQRQKGGAKEMNLCVLWIPQCKEQYLEWFLSLMAAKATGNMRNKALIRCNLNIQQGGECFSTQTAAMHLTRANAFPWHQRVTVCKKTQHLLKVEYIQCLSFQHNFLLKND